VVRSCFMMIVFWHYGYSRAFQWPMPPRRVGTGFERGSAAKHKPRYAGLAQ
jgi:hypothetical protein